MSRFVRGLLYAGPFLILIGGAVYLGLRWEDIPERFAIHWGFGGAPNGWAGRTFFGVFGLPVIGFFSVLVVLVLAALISRIGRNAPTDPERERAAVMGLVAELSALSVAWMLSLVMTAASVWLPLRRSESEPTGLIAVTIAGVALDIILTLSMVIWAARTSARIGKPPDTPAQFWKAKVFYYNPDDKRLWVEKRFGYGWTLNMGHRAAWWMLTGLIALIALSIAAPLTIASFIR